MLLLRPSLIALQLPLICARAMSTNSQLNAAGLSPKQSKDLPERQPEGNEGRILQAIKELYSCKPTKDSYKVYTESAQFHDPVGHASGLDSIKAQFNGLAQIFAKADIQTFRLLKNPPTLPSSTILIDQDIEYHFRETSTSGIKTVNSLLTIETNSQGLITKHTEEWDHEKTSSAEDGTFFGKVNEARKKLTATVVDKLVSKDPPPKNEL